MPWETLPGAKKLEVAWGARIWASLSAGRGVLGKTLRFPEPLFPLLETRSMST